MTRIAHMVDTWMARHFKEYEHLKITSMQTDDLFTIYEDVLISDFRDVEFEEFRVRVRDTVSGKVTEATSDILVVGKPEYGRNYYQDKLERQEREKEEEAILQQFRDRPRLDLQMAKSTKVLYESIQTI